MATNNEILDVVIVGAGAGNYLAGLQAAARILQRDPSLRVLVLERCSVSGGRVRDIKLTDGVEITGLGAWRIDSESKLVLKLLKEHDVKVSPWKTDVKRIEANGVCVESLDDLRSKAFPSITEDSRLAKLNSDSVPGFLQELFLPVWKEALQENKPLPTRLADVVREALGEGGERFLSVLSHGYKALAEYDIDIVGSLGSANAGSGATRPTGGMSDVIRILESKCKERGADIRHCALVKYLRRASDTGSTYEVGYVASRGRVLPGSDSIAALDFENGATTITVTARSVILAIPPRAISRLAEDQQQSLDGDLLQSIIQNPIFRSCFGIPAFRAVALYDRAWWDDKAIALKPLGERGTLLTSSSRLSLVMSYAGRGAHGEAALHISYCNDSNARRHGGFWSECINDALAQAGTKSPLTPQGDRSPAVDKVMYRHIRLELAKAFVLPLEDIPDPLRFEWHYWDDGAIHAQMPVENSPSISRKTVEEWAVNGPISFIDPSGVDRQDHIVLAGEAFAEQWAWVEGALHSALAAADTVLNWI